MSKHCFYCNQDITHGTPCSNTDQTPNTVRHCPKLNEVTPKLKKLNNDQKK